jgi:hypothetical protein
MAATCHHMTSGLPVSTVIGQDVKNHKYCGVIERHVRAKCGLVELDMVKRLGSFRGIAGYSTQGSTNGTPSPSPPNADRPCDIPCWEL